MPSIRSVTVYAASAPEAPARLRAVARALGAGIAARGWLLVYGGARIGLMGEVADAALAGGGRVEGVILDTFARVAHDRLHALDTVGDMRSRKAALAHRGDAFVTLPGGFGTLEELSEILVERQLGFHAKPLVLVNVDGFWDPLLALVDRQIAAGLVRPAYRELLTVVADARAALAALDAAAARPVTGVAPDLGKLEGRG
ncbi:MAG: TIGR00730 family Rossman fold protein [Deltaproteobacteria bacterium]|nr:TIGR00730 family Rossman fold protein [Deltaproteobacteria bacterium]